ncbi:olfactory receptor 4K3-like [Apodemus sylvaticus]|uniref:olfactory receptor 4K3-like n=1 Tax=Apodemus sylvaticus TaxID=10129 RepID=UPI00224413FD|nr:olfactory receptor 4K3-like [Apodemus sylvaticus]
MAETNHTVISQFIFLGLCTSRELEIFLLLPFSILYLMTVIGNLFLVIMIITNQHLHSHMSFLLANLSFIDFCLFSINAPKLTIGLLNENKTISFEGCMSKSLCVHFFAGSDIVLPVTMDYDRCVAICRLLHYCSIMDRQKHFWLIVISWIIGFVHGISQMLLILDLPFCGPRVLDSFFCDIPLVMKLAYMNTDTLEIIINAESGILATTCFILLLIYYTYILLTVQLRSKDGSSKALSTCTSHIVVVVLFFGPITFLYLWPVNIT